MTPPNSRRKFIKTSAWAGGGLLLAIAIPVTLFRKGAPATDFPFRQDFLRIGTDNSIEVILAEVEMGQGIWTTLPMLLAEELDCNWKDIKVSHAPPGTAKDFQAPTILKSTGGSESTVSQFDAYRQAGAVARTMLVKAAATQWGIDEEKCTTEQGYVIAGNKKSSFGDLALAAAKLPIPEVKLRDAKQWKYIGKSQNRLDIPEKISGKAVYGIDIEIPGKQIALVAHPPVFGGTVISFDASKAKAVPGVTEIVQIPTGLAVLATNFWAAKKGRELLEIVWNHGANENIDTHDLMESYSALAKTKGVSFVKKGDVETALKKAPQTIVAEYRFPFLAHAPMEPLNCTVKIAGGICEIWAGTQAPLSYQEEVAKYLGFKPAQVLFYTPHLGGGFGRRGSFNADWIMEAVHIAKISGQIIQLIWTREDDIKGAYYRPVYVHRVEVGVSTDGYPIAWKHCIVGQSLFTNTSLEKLIVVDGIDYSVITNGAPYTDHIADQGSELILTKVGVPVLPWRSVGNTHTAFVMETLIDELAAIKKMDPVAYRRYFYTTSPRHAAVMNLAVEKSGWHEPLPAGKFMGIAVHAAMGSYVAQVVEISLADGKITIERIVCAIDCGLAVNPDGVRAQMEGGIVFGLTAALYGEITLTKGRVNQSNFHDYPLLRINQIPKIEVHIVDSQEKMGGAGEPGVPPVAPALANAIFAATGKMNRVLPIKNYK